MKPLCLFLILLRPGLLTAIGDEFVTLTDTEGRSIQAKIVVITAGVATVAMENGRQYRIPMDRLDEKSKQVLDQWRLKGLENLRDPVKFNVRSFTENVEVGSTESTRTRTYDEGYTVTVENGSPMILPEMTLQYMVVKENEPRAAKSRHDISYSTKKGSAKVPSLNMRESHTFNTETFEMERSSLKGGWSYVGGGKKSSRDGLAGIWIRIMSGNTVVYEYIRPSSLSDKVDWEGAARR